MKILQFAVISLAVGLMASPCLAIIGVPSLVESNATVPGGTGQVLTLMVVPDGSGPAFTEATDPAGNVVDATIEVFLADNFASPIPGYPREDIWLEWDASSAGLAICTPRRYGGGVFETIHLDTEMDDQGISHFSLPPHAGGYIAEPVYVAISGSRLINNAGLPLRFNSPDISGDGQVDLTDVAAFAADFFGAYHFRSDLIHDGNINLSDVGRLAQYLGAGCP
jgi:hypothetical protein